jgi:cyclophilin family peptidyl-prolyl cis-trans isomerase
MDTYRPGPVCPSSPRFVSRRLALLSVMVAIVGIRWRPTTRVGLAFLVAALTMSCPATAQIRECWTSPPTMDDGVPQWSEPPQMVIDPHGTYRATIATNRGTIVVALFAEQAPITVNNFVCLALAGYYDLTLFHRVIEGFMIQGGDPTATGRGGPGYQFDDELPIGETPYTRGTVAMANAGPDTNGSQFFIVQQDQPEEFPADYSIFGHVIDGMDVVDAIAAVTVSANPEGEISVPSQRVGIATITIADGGQRPSSGKPGP